MSYYRMYHRIPNPSLGPSQTMLLLIFTHDWLSVWSEQVSSVLHSLGRTLPEKTNRSFFWLHALNFAFRFSQENWHKSIKTLFFFSPVIFHSLRCIAVTMTVNYVLKKEFFLLCTINLPSAFKIKKKEKKKKTLMPLDQFNCKDASSQSSTPDRSSVCQDVSVHAQSKRLKGFVHMRLCQFVSRELQRFVLYLKKPF